MKPERTTTEACQSRLLEIIADLTARGHIDWVRGEVACQGAPYEYTEWAGSYNGWALRYRRYSRQIAWPKLSVESTRGTMYEMGARRVTALDDLIDEHDQPSDIDPSLPSAHIVYGDWRERPAKEWRDVLELYEQSSEADMT